MYPTIIGLLCFMGDKKLKYLSKSIKFGGATMTLYSLDGFTWSSRKNELLEIKERHDRERVTMADIRGESSAEEEKPAQDEELETQAQVDDPKPPRKMAKVTKLVSKKSDDNKLHVAKSSKSNKSSKAGHTMKSSKKAAAKSKLRKKAA